jgi:hypothetical protein
MNHKKKGNPLTQTDASQALADIEPPRSPATGLERVDT